jgi:hypothetical protein
MFEKHFPDYFGVAHTTAAAAGEELLRLVLCQFSVIKVL